MRLKDEVLLLLKKQEGEYISGQSMAETLYVSRAAVWKAVKSLQEEGYPIEAITNKGYVLKDSPDLLSAALIEKELEKEGIRIRVEALKTIDSTNTELKRRALSGETEDLFLIAETQTGGRGRVGRSFHSPNGSGIYMSLLLHPDLSPREGVSLTGLAAVAACLAMEELQDTKAGIKWVNDIYMREKKVAGILTEAASSLETGRMEYAIVGIGINIFPPEGGFPDEIREIAGTIFPGEASKDKNIRNRLAVLFAKHFFRYYRSLPERKFTDEYKARSFVVGREIEVLRGEESLPATVLSVDSDLRLLVRYPDGKEELLSSGEISTKLRRPVDEN